MIRKVTLLGVPWDEKSSFQRGAAGGPAAIRTAFWSASTNTWNEDAADVASLVEDAGDLSPERSKDPHGLIEAAARDLLAAGGKALFLGGDHAVTWPLVRGVHHQIGPVTILHLDAHPDLYDQLDGRQDSHACPFARIMEQRLAGRLVQCGIRTVNAHQAEQARRFGVESVPMRAGVGAMLGAVRSLEGPLYLSLDLDVLDPAFAPGLSHPEPGGLTTREVISLVQAIPAGTLVAADLVELNPVKDLRDLTARVAAKLVKEIVGRMLA
ncbi:MAG: agmatinase [Gemmatimonadota bacterium]|nr:agmatinase [Gemmatimonadota bacterium]MDH5284566.1 agmatinase [Gemmatimonadota bacterium]